MLAGAAVMDSALLLIASN
jgi:translation initiation factor 2 subunit 3